MGARIGGAWDKYWPVLLSSFGALLLTLTPVLLESEGVVRPFGVEIFQKHLLIALLLIGLGCAAVGPALLAAAIRGADALQAKVETEVRGQNLWLYEDILVPMMERLHAVVDSPAEQTERHYYTLISKACGEAASFLQNEENPVRVNYYRLKGRSGSESLDVVFKTRKVDRPKLDRSTPSGEMILERTLRGDGEYCFDLQGADSHLGDPLSPRKYRCFASVAVKSDGIVYGMLSANTKKPGGMEASSESFLQLFASILAIAEAKLGEARGKKISA